MATSARRKVAAPLSAAHRTARRDVSGTSPPAQRTRAVSGRWGAVHAADRAEPNDPRGEASEGAEGDPHSPSHVLLVARSARGAGESDSGTRRSCGSDDDAA